MEERDSQQLSALAAVDALLGREGVAYWLFGGWAVDFYAGSITRAHFDVDIAVWLDELPRISALLEGDGWTHVPSSEDNGGTGFERGRVRLELTFLVRDEDERVYIPLRESRAFWPEGTFGEEVRALHDTHARIIGLEALTHGKSSPRDDPEDAAKDRADFGLLSRL